MTAIYPHLLGVFLYKVRQGFGDDAHGPADEHYCQLLVRDKPPNCPDTDLQRSGDFGNGQQGVGCSWFVAGWHLFPLRGQFFDGVASEQADQGDKQVRLRVSRGNACGLTSTIPGSCE